MEIHNVLTRANDGEQQRGQVARPHNTGTGQVMRWYGQVTRTTDRRKKRGRFYSTTLRRWYTSRFDRMVQEDRTNLISHGSCISVAVRLKRLRPSVSLCPFQIQHAVYQTDELHPPAKECPPAGLKSRKGWRSRGTVTLEKRQGRTSRPSPCFKPWTYIDTGPCFNPSMSAV